MPERFPGYDVLAKWDTLSWNNVTRRVISERLAIRDEPRFFTAEAFVTLQAVADRVVPQPLHRRKIPVAGLIDDKLMRDQQDGYRAPGMPPQREGWRRGLRALNAEAGAGFQRLGAEGQDALLARMERGDLHHPAWEGMPPAIFWKQRMLRDIVLAYWSHPTAWNEIGWGGPASPRGYVRLGYDERDPWEAKQRRDFGAG